MTTQEFRLPGRLLIQWRTPREGPNSFLTWWPDVSRIFLDKEALIDALEDRPEGLEEWFATLKNQPQDHGQDQP